MSQSHFSSILCSPKVHNNFLAACDNFRCRLSYSDYFTVTTQVQLCKNKRYKMKLHVWSCKYYLFFFLFFVFCSCICKSELFQPYSPCIMDDLHCTLSFTGYIFNNCMLRFIFHEPALPQRASQIKACLPAVSFYH